LDGIDGTKDISAAGVCYFFARGVRTEHMNLAHLALIGAVGDIQEHFGFTGLNKEILKDALQAGVLELREGLRMFGLYTKPLSKVFEYSTSPYLPGITGNRDGAIRFLEESGIAPKGRGATIRFTDLKPETAQRLLILLKEKTSDPSIGPVYLLPHEGDNTPFRDVKEFSTVLNSCGRMGRTGLGVGVCLKDSACRREALELLQEYRREIIHGLEWFYAHRGKPQVVEQPGFTIINAEGFIRDTLIGTIASLISKSQLYPDNTILMSMAHTLGGETKVSTRLCGFQPSSAIDLRLIIKQLVEQCGGYGGGHRLAAGATIPQDKEQLFLSSALALLSKTVSAEPVLA
jgi:RecJ-like exonuclease